MVSIAAFLFSFFVSFTYGLVSPPQWSDYILRGALVLFVGAAIAIVVDMRLKN
jgi:hypothetical protein